jgi:hypothetical protein
VPYPYYEYQLDIVVRRFTKSKFEQGMAYIDIFTKFAVVVPMKGKKKDIAAGILECMHKTGKKPRRLITKTMKAQ